MKTIRAVIARAHEVDWPGRVVVYLVAVFIVGILAGLLWHNLITLPVYTAAEDGSVVMTERAQANYFSPDAFFALIGCLAGLAVGYGSWLLFYRLGWVVSFVSVLGGTLSGLLCWSTGESLGPKNFASRVAMALPGDQIPIDFALHAPAALLLWALGAIVPVMLYANLSTWGLTGHRPFYPEPEKKPAKSAEE